MHERVKHTIFRHCQRGGMSVIEVTTALLIVGFAMMGLAQMLSISAEQRRTTEARRLAVLEVANQAERIALLSWSETTAEKLGQIALSDELRAFVPSAKVSITLADEAGPPAARRIDIRAEWDAAGETAEPVRLSLWKHEPAEARP